MIALGYIGAVLMGLSLGLIGGGGSILSVPIFVYLFKIPPVLATAYSLFVVGIASLVGGLKYLQKGQVDFKTGIKFAVPAFVGVFLVRRFVIPGLPETILSTTFFQLGKDALIMSVFAVIMLLASISMIRGRKEAEKKKLSPQVQSLIIVVEGLVVGGVTGFVGAGGGFLIIPALVLLTGLSMKVAVGTSLFIIASKSLVGFLGDLSVQTDIDWKFLFIFTFISLIGIFLGSALSSKVPDQKLKVGFGYFVLVMGAFILFKQF